MNLTELMDEELNQPLPARIAKVLDTATEHGWELNGKGCTIVVRLDHPTDPDAVPFYAGWQLVTDKNTGKRSWRFSSAGAANFQSMNYGDVLTYLADPTVIWPEPDDKGDE